VNERTTPSRSLRRRALVVSYVAYATYYLGRKAFSAVKRPIHSELGLAPSALGGIDTAFLAAYALGQFPSGLIGDRIGSRKLVGYGLLASAVACAAFGHSGGFAAFALFFALNGLAQATGYPGSTRVVAEWTRPAERATVMGVWSTCYQVGGLVATWLAGFLSARIGWRSALYAPAVVSCGVAVLVLVALPKPPAPAAVLADTGAEPSSAQNPLPVVTLESVGSAQRRALANPALWLFGASYFFIKLVRYALLLWLPYYLGTVQGYSTERAANVSLAFDAGGTIGVVLIGRFADRLRVGKAALSAVWIVALVPVLYAYSRLLHTGTLANVAMLALVGALLFGPDSLLSGAAAQEAGGTQAAATAVGFVNGIGSLGAVFQGIVVPPIAERYGWSRLFLALAVFAFGAALMLVPVLRARPNAGTPPER
jgi:sugar phosphate permease